MTRGGWGPYDPYDPYGRPRRRGWSVVGTPFGVFASSRGGFGRYGYGRGPGYGGGGGCARDACLLETGCCLAEGLDGSCLLLAVLAVPQLLLGLVRPGPSAGRAAGLLLDLVATYRRTVSARRSRPVCRFTPSCSAYAEQAITRYGAGRGLVLTVGRLLRCRPGSAGGDDPVR